jgi:uncharacterized protein (TIGR03083 family)
MDRTAFLDALDRDGIAFADSCAAAGLETPVASCPGWSVADLLWHLGEVHFFWCAIVRDHMASYEGYQEPERPEDDQLLPFYRSTFAETRQVLAEADPAAPVWTWSKDHTVGFVVRRMAHETAVHRWDADQAAKRDMPIEAELASDGIDEFLEHFMDAPGESDALIGHSVHIHCTDVAGEWLVRTSTAGFEVTREHAKGDCAIRGAASDVLLALWRRQALSDVDVVGDADLAAHFIARNNLN